MNPYSSLAQKALKSYLETRQIIELPENLPEEMLIKQAGIFVTLEKGKELRGCIGTFLPVYNNIASEIIHNAIAAGIQDYRFLPVTSEEIPDLSFSVSILSKPEKVRGPEDLDPKKYGVIVHCEETGQRGLLLPDLEGVDTPEKQIAICLEKGGIDPTRSKKISLYRFTVKKYTDKS